MPILFRKYWSFIILICLCLQACNGHKDEKKGEQEDKPVSVTGTPVTVGGISTEPMTEYIDLNATATFLQKSYVKTNVNGYIATVSVQPGVYVKEGQSLFVVKTKEAQSIGEDVNKLDPGFHFSGVNNLKAGSSGYITQLNHQKGDYVQDGELLAVISDANSFAFILNLPYDLKKNITFGGNVPVTLPDGVQLTGILAGEMPTVDPVSQTQNIIIKIQGNKNIPENLVAKVRIVKMRSNSAVSVPKAAVLTNDAQTEFWVMKLIDSTTAVKVPITKGVENKDMIEIKESQLTEKDKILISGNYGLPDTAKVSVVK